MLKQLMKLMKPKWSCCGAIRLGPSTCAQGQWSGRRSSSPEELCLPGCRFAPSGYIH